MEKQPLSQCSPWITTERFQERILVFLTKLWTRWLSSFKKKKYPERPNKKSKTIFPIQWQLKRGRRAISHWKAQLHSVLMLNPKSCGVLNLMWWVLNRWERTRPLLISWGNLVWEAACDQPTKKILIFLFPGTWLILSLPNKPEIQMFFPFPG